MARGAVDDALLDALDDAGEPEQVIGKVPVELLGHRHSIARRVAQDDGIKAPDAEGSQVESGEPCCVVVLILLLHRAVGKMRMWFALSLLWLRLPCRLPIMFIL